MIEKKHVSNDVSNHVSNEKAVIKFTPNCLIIRDPGVARTHGPLIKSQLLYQLSYRVIELLLRKDLLCE